MGKKIEELNAKWWYRLIKVIYVGLFVLALLLVVIGAFSKYGPKFDAQKTYVSCNNGTNINPKDYGVNLYSEFIWTDDDKKLNFACLSNKDIGEIAKTAYPNTYNDLSDEEIGKRVRERNFDFYKKVALDQKTYKLIPAYTERDWSKTFGFSFIIVLLVTFIFEGTRRLFYYVSLGKWFPKE